MSNTNQSNKNNYRISQTIAVSEPILRKLSNYVKITESQKSINTFFTDINNFLPKISKILVTYEKQKKQIDDLRNENQEYKELASEDFNDKEKLANELKNLRANIEKREQQYIEKESFIEEQYNKTLEQQELFEKYSRIYLSFAIPMRYSILGYFFDTQNNLATKMVYEHLLKDPEILKMYPKLSKTIVNNHLKKLSDLGYLKRIMQGLYKISQNGTEYYLESINSTEKEQIEGEKYGKAD